MNRLSSPAHCRRWRVWWFYVALRRFGLVALMVASFVQSVMLDFPAAFNSSAWDAGYGYVALAIVAAIAIYGFKTSLGGRPVFAGTNLDA